RGGLRRSSLALLHRDDPRPVRGARPRAPLPPQRVGTRIGLGAQPVGVAIVEVAGAGCAPRGCGPAGGGARRVRAGGAPWRGGAPPPGGGCPVARAGSRARDGRGTQYVPFSITPRWRTVTWGLRCAASVSVVVSAYCRKLNRRTLYGQLLEQKRVPMQRL